MATSLSNLVDNLEEGIKKNKCKDCDCFLKYESVKDNLIKYKCLSCNKDYSNKLDEKFKKRFKNTFKFSDNEDSIYIYIYIYIYIRTLVERAYVICSTGQLLEKDLKYLEKVFYEKNNYPR